MLAGSECAGDTTAHDTCQQSRDTETCLQVQNVCVSVNAGSIMTNVKQQKLLHKAYQLTIASQISQMLVQRHILLAGTSLYNTL